MKDPTPVDHLMIGHAKQRHQVVVASPGRAERTATLICWMRRTARVEFSTGSRCTVYHHQILSVVDPDEPTTITEGQPT